MNRKKIITSGLVVLTLALSSSLCAFAANNTTAGNEVKTAISGKLHPGKVQLTDAQRTAIQNARKNSMKLAAANLVTNRILTQTEADELLANMDKAPAATKSKTKGTENVRTKVNSMFANLTDAQIKALRDEKSTAFKNELAALVNNGTISQDIADQIQKSPMVDGKGHGRRGMKKRNKTAPENNNSSTITN